MKFLAIDFAPASVRRTLMLTPFTSWLGVIFALAFCTAIASRAAAFHKKTGANYATVDRLLQKAKAQSKEQADRTAAAHVPALSEAEAKAVNNAISELNLPWSDVFDAIETALPPTIALLSIEPEAKKKILVGVAEVSGSEDMIAAIEALKKQPLFQSVLLTRHETNVQDPNRPLRFQFEAQWRDGAP